MTIGKIGLQAQGPQGETGPQGLQGATGPQGSQGLSSLPVVFNTVSRYAAVTIPGMEVWIVSSSSIYTNVNWSRSGIVMTINRVAHGHSTGNMVIIRNTNLEYQTATIDSVTSDSFNITTTNIGDLSGIIGSYSLGFTYQHVGNPSTAGILYAPTGDHADCQLLTLRIRTGVRLSTTYNVTVPASSINGAGNNTNLGDCFVPDYNVRSDADNLSATPATIVTGSLTGSYSIFQIANLGTLSKIIILHF